MTKLQSLLKKCIDSRLLTSCVTSRLRRELGYRLLTLQGFALISPLEGFSHGAVEVIDEFNNAGFQLNFAAESLLTPLFIPL